MTPKHKILCVDDEPAILDSLELTLGREFEMVKAGDGAEALERVRAHPDLKVIVSDMRMPRMNGAEFLKEASAVMPYVPRILLTGQTDLTSAIEAVNEGKIFRFLTKPVRHFDLISAVRAGLEQHRLVTAEKELLEKTLTGSIKALVELVSMFSPRLSARSTKIAGMAARLAQFWNCRVPGRWKSPPPFRRCT